MDKCNHRICIFYSECKGTETGAPDNHKWLSTENCNVICTKSSTSYKFLNQWLIEQSLNPPLSLFKETVLLISINLGQQLGYRVHCEPKQVELSIICRIYIYFWFGYISLWFSTIAFWTHDFNWPVFLKNKVKFNKSIRLFLAHTYMFNLRKTKRIARSA